MNPPNDPHDEYAWVIAGSVIVALAIWMAISLVRYYLAGVPNG